MHNRLNLEQQLAYTATPESKRKEREEIERLTKEYLASGKTISRVGNKNEQISD